MWRTKRSDRGRRIPRLRATFWPCCISDLHSESCVYSAVKSVNLFYIEINILHVKFVKEDLHCSHLVVDISTAEILQEMCYVALPHHVSHYPCLCLYCNACIVSLPLTKEEINVFAHVCLSVSLSVSKITQKRVHGFG